MSSTFRKKGRPQHLAASLQDIVDSLTWYWIEQAGMPREEAKRVAAHASFECLEILRSYEPDPGPYRAWEK